MTLIHFVFPILRIPKTLVNTLAADEKILFLIETI